VIACIEDPAVIRKILNHLEEKSPLDSEKFYCFTQVVAGNGFDRVSEADLTIEHRWRRMRDYEGIFCI
jgi:hypothetical protein